MSDQQADNSEADLRDVLRSTNGKVTKDARDGRDSKESDSKERGEHFSQLSIVNNILRAIGVRTDTGKGRRGWRE